MAGAWPGGEGAVEDPPDRTLEKSGAAFPLFSDPLFGSSFRSKTPIMSSWAIRAFARVNLLLHQPCPGVSAGRMIPRVVSAPAAWRSFVLFSRRVRAAEWIWSGVADFQRGSVGSATSSSKSAFDTSRITHAFAYVCGASALNAPAE